jgi:hypothetical protein
VIDELERSQKEAVMAQLRYYPSLPEGTEVHSNLRLIDILAEIRTEPLLNMSLRAYCSVQSLSGLYLRSLHPVACV